LAVYDGELIAGGYFTTADGIEADYIARWNGTSWQSLGSGMSAGAASYPGVFALTMYNRELIAGGGFTSAGGVSANYIARWNGTSWSDVGGGTGIDYRPYALTVYDGELIAGGLFFTAGGFAASHIARWDGASWRPLGTGMDY